MVTATSTCETNGFRIETIVFRKATGNFTADAIGTNQTGGFSQKTGTQNRGNEQINRA